MEEGELKKRGEREKFQIVGKIKPDKEVKSLEGFKVMAYVAGTKKQLGSAITDADGTYEIKFEYDEPVDVNISVCPDVNEAMLKAIPKAKHFVPKDAWVKRSPYSLEADIPLAEPTILLWETICEEYIIYGIVVQGTPDSLNPGSYLDLTPIPNVTVHICDVNPQPSPPQLPPSFLVSTLGTATTDENGLFSFIFNWCYQGSFEPPWPDFKPDLIFLVTQNVNNVQVKLYEEDPSKTRWNIDQIPPFGVCLIVEGDVIVSDDEMTPIEGDFEFHGIGNVLISDMNPEGYVDASGSPFDESPFGSTIHVKGQFNDELQGKYYQVSYAKWANDNTPPEDPDFAPILDEAWLVAKKIGNTWVTFYKSPIEVGGIEGCYEIPDYYDIYLTSKDILISWRTDRIDLGAPRYPDGKYTLKVKAFEVDGTGEITLGGDTELNVRIDNTWPVAEIKDDIYITGGTIPLCPQPEGIICDDPEECGIIHIEQDKKVRIKFDAYDEQNHFRSYKLTYRTGGGGEIPIPGGSKNFIGPPRNDYGFTDETVDWDISGLSQCGYEITLKVLDRTTNGYILIHRTEDSHHLILLENSSG
jgi:hypothetical protein